MGVGGGMGGGKGGHNNLIYKLNLGMGQAMVLGKLQASNYSGS